MNELALFAGAGGGILGGKLLGWRTVCAVERDAYAAQVLAQRQNDGALPAFPVWSDVCSFDGRPWRGIVDVVSGGFPCQDISVAGRGAGIDGERSGLWREFARIIREVGPRFVFVENSPVLTGRGLGTVLGDLAALGFDAEWGVLGASAVGAPHRRDRIWIVANANCLREPQPEGGEQNQQGRVSDSGKNVADADSFAGHQRWEDHPEEKPKRRHADRGSERTDIRDTNCSGLAQWEGKRTDKGEKLAPVVGANWWATEPDVGRVAHGVAHRVDRLRALGNGQVPQCAAEAFQQLRARF